MTALIILGIALACAGMGWFTAWWCTKDRAWTSLDDAMVCVTGCIYAIVWAMFTWVIVWQ